MSYINIILVSLTAVLLSSCGGGSSPATTTSNNLTGTFIDAAVEGITIERDGNVVYSATHTDKDGKFTYKAGEKLTFRIGNLILGENKTVPESGIITPLYLVNGETDTSEFEQSSAITLNATAALMLQVLQSLDDDAVMDDDSHNIASANNGIRITQAVRDRLSHFSVSKTLISHSTSTLFSRLGNATNTIFNASRTVRVAKTLAVNRFRGTLIQERRGKDGIADTSTRTFNGQSHQSQIRYISDNHANYFNNNATKTNEYRPPEFTSATNTAGGGTLTWKIYGKDATHTKKMQEHITFMANRLSNANGLARFTRRFDKLFVIQVAVKPYFDTTLTISGDDNDILTVTKSATNSCVYDIILEHALSVQTNFFKPPADTNINLTGDGTVAADAIITSDACQADDNTAILKLITDAVASAWTIPNGRPIPRTRPHDHSSHTDPSSSTHSGNIQNPPPRIVGGNVGNVDNRGNMRRGINN